jgi:16S rRNA (guanine1207-N2)-methyltransferase
MRAERFTYAVETGALVIPAAGRIAVYGPATPMDISVFPRDRVQVVTRYRPDHDAMTAADFQVAPVATPGAAMALVCVPRAKDATRAMIHDAALALAPGGVLVLDGQKLDGIDGVIKMMKDHVPVGEAVAKAHGRLVSIMAAPVIAGWQSQPHHLAEGFVTRPGVFSADGPDPASVLLAQTLPSRIGRRVVDLGAGWGYLSRAILNRDAVERLDMVEADGVALDCARQNIVDPRAAFHWADALTFRPDLPADAVVCNPPFHTSRQADPGLGIAFIQAAQRMLAQDGALWMVANRHLPYDAVLAAAFRDVTEIGGTKAYRVIRAYRPQRSPKKS